MTKDQELIAWLRQTFHGGRKVTECLHKSIDTETTVCETSGEDTVCIFNKDALAGLHIKNSNRKEVHLFALDHCFFTPGEYHLKRCDCLVFDDQCCCFVELKINIKKWKNYNKNADDAVLQLGQTILFLDASHNHASPAFLGFEREAYIVTHPRLYPKNQASREKRRVKFLQAYGITLYETDTKNFLS